MIKTKSNRFILTILFLFVFGIGQVVSGQVVTFAQFLEQNGTQDFIFTNNAVSGQFTTVAGGSPIFFRYQNISSLPAELQGFQSAHLFITTTTTTPATLIGGQLNQPFDAITTIQIIRDTPTSPGIGTGTRTNLLTAVFSTAPTTPSLSGTAGGNSATLSAATPNNNVTFTSDFLGFALTTQRAGALSFSSVIPSYSLGAGGFIQSFTAAGTGTFSSNPPPIYSVPSAAPVSVSGRVVSASGYGINRAIVQASDSNGNIRTITTNHFGYFSFEELTVGEIYIFQVLAKGRSFSPQAVSVNDSINGLNFTENTF